MGEIKIERILSSKVNGRLTRECNILQKETIAAQTLKRSKFRMVLKRLGGI